MSSRTFKKMREFFKENPDPKGKDGLLITYDLNIDRKGKPLIMSVTEYHLINKYIGYGKLNGNLGRSGVYYFTKDDLMKYGFNKDIFDKIIKSLASIDMSKQFIRVKDIL